MAQVLADTHGRRHTPIAADLDFSRRDSVYGDGKTAAAVIGMIIHHGRLIKFSNESYRVRHLPVQQQPSGTPRGRVPQRYRQSQPRRNPDSHRSGTKAPPGALTLVASNPDAQNNAGRHYPRKETPCPTTTSSTY